MESEGERGDCAWLVLHSDSCDALIVPSDVEFAADPYQVLIRLARFGASAPADDQLTITTPINARELMDVLRQAQEGLGRAQEGLGHQDRSSRGTLAVKMEDWSTVPANDPNEQLSGFAAPTTRHMTDGSAALQAQSWPMASAEAERAAQPSAMAQQHAQAATNPFPEPRLVTPASHPEPQAVHSDQHEFSAAWDQIAVALYSIVQNSAPAVAEIRVENLDMIRIDFRFRAYNSRIPLEQVSANGSRIAIRSTLVEAFRPPIVNLPGESLDKLFWFIGSQAFHGAGAPWLKPEDRYRLRRWPNFTELNHAVADMRAAAAIGNCFLNAAELAGAAGIAVETAQRTLNAYSLMGLLEIQSDRTAAPVQFRQPAERTSGGLFSKLRKKLGL